ncbi:MAG: hypothetical protein IJA43_02775 [Clostridia bacterium]|nr:hypothetical protein [Clostridia bacterium]
MTKQNLNKHKIILVLLVIFLIALILAEALFYYNSLQLTKPFENLTVEEVKSISLYSQNVTQEIIYTFTDEECKEIIKLLNGIAIGKEDNQEYNGGFDRQFRLEKTDGTIIEFGTSANFWFDGQRYEVPENNISLIKLRNMHTEYYKEYYVPYYELNKNSGS